MATKPTLEVSRETKQNQDVTEANQWLRDIGTLIHASDEALARGFEYKGSVAIHYYEAPALHHPCYVTQTAGLDNVPEPLVQKGIDELREQCMVKFGRKEWRPKGRV